MNAVLLKVGTTVKVTNADRDIVYASETFSADDSLTEVDGPVGGGDFPAYSFSVICRAGSPQYALLPGGAGPELASIIMVEVSFPFGSGSPYFTPVWTKVWGHEGVLGEGSMTDDVYSGLIQHPFDYRLHALPRRYWNARQQKARASNAADKGADHVADIARGHLSTWRGINMEPAT